MWAALDERGGQKWRIKGSMCSDVEGSRESNIAFVQVVQRTVKCEGGVRTSASPQHLQLRRRLAQSLVAAVKLNCK
eukprot:6186059-Pleurochrysis_carterae.AAC.4